MIRRQLIVLAVLSVSATAGAAAINTIDPVPTIEVTAPTEIASVQSVHDALETFGRKVTACVDGGRKLDTCQCSAPQELATLRSRYQSLVKQHPEWKDQVLSHQYVDKDGRNMSGTIALGTLRRQLEMLRCE